MENDQMCQEVEVQGTLFTLFHWDLSTKLAHRVDRNWNQVRRTGSIPFEEIPQISRSLLKTTEPYKRHTTASSTVSIGS
eukprot:3583572-Rhodomonas_salina.1